MAENFLIRDVFNQRNVFKLGEDIFKIYPEFDLRSFKERLQPLFEEATFSERKSSITQCLIDLLPDDISQISMILIYALPDPYKSDSLESDMDRFIVAPMADVIAIKGILDFQLSMDTLYKMTQSFSAEWAIRPFIEKYPDKSHKLLATWADDPNAHVRRLVSEGTRPYLPWGKKLKITENDPQWSLTLLEKLINDPSKYVQTSVANHLNDLTKKHPEAVLNALYKWKSKIINHRPIPFIKKALRNLIKGGNQKALELIGYSPDVSVDIPSIICPDNVSIGEKFEFQFEVVSSHSDKQEVLIDFIIHFNKSNNTLSPKVFKLTSFTLLGKESKSISKAFSFKPITTRKYYPGPHMLEIMVNGKVKASKKFELI